MTVSHVYSCLTLKEICPLMSEVVPSVSCYHVVGACHRQLLTDFVAPSTDLIAVSHLREEECQLTSLNSGLACHYQETTSSNAYQSL